MIIQTRSADQFPLRLPSDLRAEIKASALENGRSMNSEIIFQLSRVYSRAETQKADAA